jgi:hypothetical protein
MRMSSVEGLAAFAHERAEVVAGSAVAAHGTDGAAFEFHFTYEDVRVRFGRQAEAASDRPFAARFGLVGAGLLRIHFVRFS